jgi:2,5-dioxopentanoate dehydrogenase
MSDKMVPVLVGGVWRASKSTGTFRADNPSLGEALPEVYPVSSREEVLEMLKAGSEAAAALWSASDESIAKFLEAYAEGIEKRANDFVEIAHAESALPKAPRLKDVELPRTINQLRSAAKAAREGSWKRPIRDDAAKIYSIFGPLGGPVIVMGPNNFPFAFNSAAGGDFAAAIAAHNPVIAKANTSHPGTTRLFAEVALEALKTAGLPASTVQMFYRTPQDVGLEMVAHPLTGATAFTGSKFAGMKLKESADKAGKPIYLEMSSVNPVVMLEGALKERGDALAAEFFSSCTMGAGQFCTCPSFVIVPDTDAGKKFVDVAKQKFEEATPGVLLGKGGRDALTEAVGVLQKSGASVATGGKAMPGPAYRFANTLLRVSGDDFIKNPHQLQTEAFGPVALVVTTKNTAQTVDILKQLEGNLTGCVYSDTTGKDDADYTAIEPTLRQRVGRLLNDKMPTGVAVSPAMNHGGPFPATGHPGFTAVGLPTSIQRFAALHCYDNVRPGRLPGALKS